MDAIPPALGSSTRQRRLTANTLDAQRGTLQTSKTTLHEDLTFRDRTHHFIWAPFTTTMSTGGISVLLYATPHSFKGFNTIGTVIFLFNLILFISFCAAISTRFILFPKTFLSSLSHPTESMLKLGCSRNP
ncbi:hypothetical protein EJ08DRAFT_474068 [Tothia fuscella]|uniref:Uncharacterized protein n=1 Tax=Tothia fuscella TaxID=1048955 RepID=A0A9P4NY87_9PEZI|nr:hypothetical protein EJ08DRAFT_474068 [Tothia fuscella]